MLLRDTASWLGQSAQSRRHHLNTISGGGDRTRTDDPLLAKQVLSQLSYTPFGGQWSGTSGQAEGLLAPDHWYLTTDR